MAVSISVDAVKEIAELTRCDDVVFRRVCEARRIIRDCIGWPPFDEEDNMQQSITVDFLYDIIVFCIDKAIPWTEIPLYFELSSDMLSCAKWKGIMAGLATYKSKHVLLSSCVDRIGLEKFTEFFFATFMRHYKLFHYVMQYPREMDDRIVFRQISKPPEPESLADGIEESTWQYEQQYFTITKEEIEVKNRREEEKKNTVEDDEKMLAIAYNEAESIVKPPFPARLDKETLLTAISEVTSAKIGALSHAVQFNIDEVADELRFMLEKTSLPRPEALGPPPRFPTRTTVAEPKPQSAKKK